MGSYQNIYSTTAISQDTWYNVMVTRTGTTADIYINNDGNATASASDIGTDFQSGGHILGAPNTSGSSSTLTGKLDEYSIWDIVLTSDQRAAVYNMGVPIDLSTDAGDYDCKDNLIGWWRFEENTGTNIADSSTSSNYATLVNGPTFSTDVPS